MLSLLSRQDWWPDDWPLWHWGGDGSTIYPWTTVKQGPGGSYYDTTIGMSVDRNTLYKPMKFWSGYGLDRIEPEDDVPLTDSDKEWIINTVHSVVLSLWRSDEVHTYLTMHTPEDLAEIAGAVAAEVTPSSGVAPSPEAIADELSRRLARDA